ncbi:hypothetical protein YPPY101_3798, partial [Yersinia pestis PY-101]|jgi:hypothetical protein
MWL